MNAFEKLPRSNKGCVGGMHEKAQGSEEPSFVIQGVEHCSRQMRELLQGKSCRRMHTAGGGHCGIHAIFGETQHSAVLHSAPRQLLEEILPTEFGNVTGVALMRWNDSIVTSLWTDFVVPFVYPDNGYQQPPANEEQMFLSELFKPGNEVVLRTTQEAISEQKNSATLRD